MKYTDARPQLKSGDILAWSEGDWKSWRGIQLMIVRIGTQSTYNHVGVCLVLGGRVFVVEAVTPLIRIYPLSKELPFYWIKSPFAWTEEAEAKLLEHVGLPYSKWEAIKAALTKDTNGSSSWQCAKLVNRTLMVFDKSFDDINDTPAATVNKLMDDYSCSLTYVES